MTYDELNIENSKLKSLISQNATLRECILKDTKIKCSANIINAHSLQRLGSLSRLEADVNGNKSVFALTEKQINPKTGLFELKPVGKKTASTFFGFCGNHDVKIFQSIEQNPELLDIESNEHCFLLSFKAFAISYHRKKEDINLLSTKDKTLISNIKKYFGTENIEELLEGSKLGLQDMEPNKEILIKALYSKDYSCLDFFAVELNYTAPIAMCMLTSPPYFFDGTQMNISSDPEYQYSDIFTSIIPLKSKTLIVLAAFEHEPKGFTYLKELENMNDNSFDKALTWHILTNSENCFFSPIWYDKLDEKQKHFLIQLSDFSGSATTPFLKYNSKKFPLNLFDPRMSI
jgi:hypothetical protein